MLSLSFWDEEFVIWEYLKLNRHIKLNLERDIKLIPGVCANTLTAFSKIVRESPRLLPRAIAH